jgi:hypothetical protein
MRQSKFSETQIVNILKEADAGQPVNEIWRHYGITSAGCRRRCRESSNLLIGLKSAYPEKAESMTQTGSPLVIGSADRA